MADPNRNYDRAVGELARTIAEVQEGYSTEVFAENLGHLHWELPGYLAIAIRRQPPQSRQIFKRTIDSATAAFISALIAQIVSGRSAQGIAQFNRHLAYLAEHPEEIEKLAKKA